MKKIELKPALWWYCDDCGKANYERLMSNECMTEEQNKIVQDKLEKIIEEEDLETSDIGDYISCDFMYFPSVVICGHCGSEFYAEMKGSSPEEDGYF